MAGQVHYGCVEVIGWVHVREGDQAWRASWCSERGCAHWCASEHRCRRRCIRIGGDGCACGRTAWWQRPGDLGTLGWVARIARVDRDVPRYPCQPTALV